MAMTYHKETLTGSSATPATPSASPGPRLPRVPGEAPLRRDRHGAAGEREVVARLPRPDRPTDGLRHDAVAGEPRVDVLKRAFKDGQVDILLGTQMIAKGLDFPNVTLVGVVDADTALHMPDFRAAERTFQLVAQVAGRTGRGDRPGQGAGADPEPRRRGDPPGRPPRLRILRCVRTPRPRVHGPPPLRPPRPPDGPGPDGTHRRDYISHLADALRASAPPSVRVVGPAPAPVLKIRNLFRYHLRLTAPTPRPLHDLLHTVPPTVPLPNGVELAVDVDPVSMI